MKTFIQWAQDNKLELPELSENGVRTGLQPQYPDGYVRSQYPDLYFPPIAANAPFALKAAKQFKSKAPADNAP